MLRNPITYIFKLGKHRSLPFKPLVQLGAATVTPSLPLPASQMTSDVSVKNEQARHSNQMSS